jgi:hypothetical protein
VVFFNNKRIEGKDVTALITFFRSCIDGRHGGATCKVNHQTATENCLDLPPCPKNCQLRLVAFLAIAILRTLGVLEKKSE